MKTVSYTAQVLYQSKYVLHIRSVTVRNDSINYPYLFQDHTVVDRITLNWSPSSQMVWNFGKRILQYIDEKDSIYGHLEDISVTMRKRALGGYGLDPDFKPAAELMQDSITKELWYWVDTCRQLALASNPLGANFFGVRSALKLDSDGIKSELKNIPWTGFGTCKMTPIGVYRYTTTFLYIKYIVRCIVYA